MLLVEQNARAALEIADDTCIIENGRIVMHGAAAEMRAHEDIREFSLGLSPGFEKRSFRGVKHCKRRERWLG
jgi:branched-chain amino acid transport system ATP-binding protein